MASLLSHLKGLLGGKEKPQHALLVYIRLGDDEHGSSGEREDLFELEDRLIEALDAKQAGELDGNEVGGGFFTIYIYGSSASQMWEAAAPILNGFDVPVGSYAIKRFGDPGAQEERVALGTPA